MPRHISSDVTDAEKLYASGYTTNEIAEALNKPPGTIRRWKSQFAWPDNKKKRIAAPRRATKTHWAKENVKSKAMYTKKYFI